MALEPGQLASALEVLLIRMGHLEHPCPFLLVALLSKGAFHGLVDRLCPLERLWPWCLAFPYPEGHLSSAEVRLSEWFCLDLRQPGAFQLVAAPLSAVPCLPLQS